MRKIIMAFSMLSLCGCAGMAAQFDPSQNGAIRSIGNDTYTISEMGVFGGNAVEYAARHCASMGRVMQMQGSTTQKGLASGASYGVVVFTCRESNAQ